LMLGEVEYPGWRATVDGQPTNIVRVDGLLRGVPLAPGAHRVEFAFVPGTVIVGAALSLVGLIGLGVILFLLPSASFPAPGGRS
ncbi:MAG: YfhO family protein, partial [Chloroflexi bacterium]|nr:YfhO family protein [Chloroflexota bacterium]